MPSGRAAAGPRLSGWPGWPVARWSEGMQVQIVDPSAYTPAYDHALCRALARTGAEVELVTSRFAYGVPPRPDGYRVSELFYTHAVGAPASRLRLGTKLVEH